MCSVAHSSTSALISVDALLGVDDEDPLEFVDALDRTDVVPERRRPSFPDGLRQVGAGRDGKRGTCRVCSPTGKRFIRQLAAE